MIENDSLFRKHSLWLPERPIKRLTFKLVRSTFSCNSTNDQTIDQKWEALVSSCSAQHIPIWNSLVYRLEGVQLIQDELCLNASFIEFRQALIWATNPAIGNAPFPLSVGAIIRTSDQYYMFGVKNKGPAHKAGDLVLVAGLLSHSEVNIKSYEDIVYCLHKEMSEEANIAKRDIDSTCFKGFYKTARGGALMVFECLLNKCHATILEQFAQTNDRELKSLYSVRTPDCADASVIKGSSIKDLLAIL